MPARQVELYTPPPAIILNLMQALPGLSHVYSPKGLDDTLMLQGFVLENGSACGKGGPAYNPPTRKWVRSQRLPDLVRALLKTSFHSVCASKVKDTVVYLRTQFNLKHRINYRFQLALSYRKRWANVPSTDKGGDKKPQIGWIPYAGQPELEVTSSR